MALVHNASISPTKVEALARWLPDQPWGPGPEAAVELLGSYRYDDPLGEVGLETHLVRAAGAVFHVPLTYRGGPLEDDSGLVCTMDHTALGRRWVYDGLTDEVFVRALAATIVTGIGQVTNQMDLDGRWVVALPSVRLAGGGLVRTGRSGLVDIDGLALREADGDWAVVSSDHLEVRFRRRLDLDASSDPAPAVLSATWRGQDDPVVVAVGSPC